MGGIAVVLPYAVQELVTFLIPFALLAILCLALNLQWGHTGLFNAGIAGFYAIGAYTAGILLTGPAPPDPFSSGHIGGFSQPFGVALIGGFLAAAITGFFIGIVTLRLREDYLAIGTLALAEIIRIFLQNAESLTGGHLGILSIPRPFDFLGLGGPESDASLAVLFVGSLLIGLFALDWMTRAPWGRALRAIREDEEAAQVLGKDTFWLKLQAFTIGCGLMGVAGVFLAVYSKVVSPDFFVPFTTFSVFVAVLLGGSGNNRAVLVGAGIFFLFDWASIRLKDYLPDVLSDRIAYYRLIAIGLILILLVLYRPQGVLPERRYVSSKG